MQSKSDLSYNAVILDAKRKLMEIKRDSKLTKEQKINDYNHFLKIAARIIQASTSPLLRGAASLLLADLYTSIALIYIKTEPDKACRATREAIHGLCYARDKMRFDFSDAETDFIRSSNTYALSNPDDALALIRTELLPELRKASDTTMFTSKP